MKRYYTATVRVSPYSNASSVTSSIQEQVLQTVLTEWPQKQLVHSPNTSRMIDIRSKLNARLRNYLFGLANGKQTSNVVWLDCKHNIAAHTT